MARSFLALFSSADRLQFDRLWKRFVRGKKKRKFSDKGGNSLLHWAIREDRLEKIPQLLDLGIKKEKKNKIGLTAVDYARFLDKQCSLYEKKRSSSVKIYRNADQKTHLLSIESFEKKVQIEYVDSLIFEKAAYLDWIVKKCNRCLRKTSVKQMNRWMLALHKEEIERKRNDHIYIRSIDNYLGYGVFAAKDIPPLSYIGEYAGVVKRRKKKVYRRNNYVFGYITGPKDSPFIIDAEKKGNFVRFINHSSVPNLLSRWVIDGGITRIIFFSNQFIPQGKQLTYDYGKYYWRKRDEPLLIV